jgi:serine protease inhibitor
MASYAYGKYAFVALFPNEGVNVQDYVSSLNCQKALEMLNSVSNEKVHTKMSKFKAEYTILLTGALKRIGIMMHLGAVPIFQEWRQRKTLCFIIIELYRKHT